MEVISVFEDFAFAVSIAAAAAQMKVTASIEER